ncbi:MAG TPA: phosphatidylinositol-specific phospholipase C domain-containing protein [Oligoflexus sp.]|uniref:phosphatidylinositol-specific phospholipase C domain-containing protein n=1 Tax=Oligoflexus sp. TaxID=1971216 RepID=UPI002D7F6C34|nr:phosphatidylinositol-specific phospholipase C domain-containing protein [Oligoflexus sp.]HET9240449.1 phosphatidylinositol-specific phospholipase C domain-containing protein [Oligoflexus sp.]
MVRLGAFGLFLLSLWTQAFAQVNPSDWMSEIYAHKPEQALRQIIIPGTHDTGTDQMTSGSGAASALEGIMKIAPKGAVVAWSKTQDRSMGQQLEDGIRYFDMRVENTPSGWMTYHGLLSNRLTDMLAELAAFFENHPHEIVLLDFQSLVNFNNDVTELVSYFENHPVFRSRVAPWGEFNPQVRLGDLWDADKNLILLFDQRRVRLPDGSWGDSSFVWPRTLQNPWSNTRHTAKVEEDILNGIRQRPDDIFYVSQAVLTPDANVVTTGWTRGITSLRDMAVKWMNPKFAALLPRLDQSARDADKHVNIIIADFYQHGSFVDLCLRLNQQNAGG